MFPPTTNRGVLSFLHPTIPHTFDHSEHVSNNSSEHVKVMIVDDSRRMRSMIASLLTDGDTRIDECSDGIFAEDMYRRIRPDWVIMDIKMNEMDGLAATRAIRRSFPDANVVIVTNYDDVQLREDAAQAGAVGYVLKENLQELRRMLFREK